MEEYDVGELDFGCKLDMSYSLEELDIQTSQEAYLLHKINKTGEW